MRGPYVGGHGPLSLRFTGFYSPSIDSVHRLAPLMSTGSHCVMIPYSVWCVEETLLGHKPQMPLSIRKRFLESSVVTEMGFPCLVTCGEAPGKSAPMSTMCFYQQTY